MGGTLRITLIVLTAACFLRTMVYAGSSASVPPNRGPHIQIGSPQYFGGSDFIGLWAYTNPRSANSDRGLYSGVLFVGRWSFGAVIQPNKSHFHFGPYHFVNVKVKAATMELVTVLAVLFMAVAPWWMRGIWRRTLRPTINAQNDS